MKIRGAARTDPGRVRRENQDNFGLATDLGLGFVADGMGGHAGGRRASEEAARVITESLAAGAPGGMDGGVRLRRAIEEANRRVWTVPQFEPALHGLGTTVAAVLIEGDVGHIAHVGDSRVYGIRDGTIEALTRDHSYLNDLAARGVELTDPALRARYESVLTRAIGVAPTVDVEVAARPVAPGDTFLLCSDGVYRVLSSEQLAIIVEEGGEDLDRICATIITRANDGGGPDNSTVVVLRIDADDAGAP
ncbi:MAG: serine/threonine-protein phosphatase [Deltaproteobacteria bacterium]|nr:serine/threonine-protein phosphatase [Deltaproteobacteria bacterium]